MSSSSATALLALAVLLLLTTASAAAPIIGLDSFLSHQSRIDPHASNDSFLSLPPSIKNPLSLLSDISASSLLSLSLPISLSLHLIGDFPPDAPSLLSAYLSAAAPTAFHVITPFNSHPLSHSLSLSHTLHLHITPSQSLSSLTSLLAQTLTSHLRSTPSSLSSQLLSIPHSSIDSIIQNHFRKHNPNPNHVHLYLLNLPPLSDPKPYAYTYSPGESSAAVTKCSGTFFTSADRFFWIDLRAGPVNYGPAISGDGVIPRGEFHPLAALHGRPKSHKAFAADLASLVWSAYHVFLAPSLRIPVPFENSLTVQFIHIHSDIGSKDFSGLDWKLIEKSFRFDTDNNNNGNDNGLLLGDQSLSFKNYEIRFSECPICSFAIARSTNSYTSRFLFDNYTLLVSEYLDSKRLHRILSDSGDELRKLAGVPEEDFSRIVPVYVFDLDYTSLLLLDRYHQSVAFKDMVIAVRTRNTQTVSDYSCNGRNVFMQTRKLERPIIGSILQSMWGVSPTHLNWSPQHNETLVDYTWSMGQTPFGPFSEMMSLSFVQKDAARRNVLLTSLNYSVTSAIDVLQSIETHGGAKNLLKQRQHVEFVQRWNLFKYKLNKAVSAMSHLDFEMALFYLRSSDHDLYAIHSIVYHASQEIEVSLLCFKDPPFPWGSVSVSASAFLALSYVYARRDKLFKNKRKQF
ncbi:unnamed protein product [Sphenostylis stenocarpa]|uniref:DUF7906 domain-containing protein n=1 Tax=Sphenostylis stenocarpa TaxID=92480 RepID=A0AA86VA97_9FABA|nr:unnamed protein product [Sphenostylis stenocarpa]